MGIVASQFFAHLAGMLGNDELISPTTLILSVYVTNALRYYMIKSFACQDTETMYNGIRVARFVNIEKVAMRKLAMLERAANIADLRAPPNNRLERLKGNRQGQYSIRINDQWRICFVWTGHDVECVEIVDYH